MFPLVSLTAAFWEAFAALPISLQVGLVLVGWAAAAWLGNRFLYLLLSRLAKRTKSELDDALVSALNPSFGLFVFAGGTWVSLHAVAITDSGARAADGLLFAVALVAAAVSSVRLARGLLLAAARRKPRYRPMARLGSRSLSAVVWVLAGLMVLDHYGIAITPILTTLGIAGLAVALALQDTLANFFSGLWIQSSRSMDPGHFVRLENEKIEGFVDDVGWRTTKIQTLSGNLVIVPNKTVAQDTVTDFWLPDPRMGTGVTVFTGFETDPDRIVPLLLEEANAAAQDEEFILKEPAPAARLNRFADHGWEFWVGFWVAHYSAQWNAQGHVLNRIRKRFQKEGIRIPLQVNEQIPVPLERPEVARSAVGRPGREPHGNGHHAEALTAPERSGRTRAGPE